MRVDLRSDTVTQPTPEMRRAMAEAEVGDDVFGEDPTVNRLQEMAAEMLGKEAALFLPSGTMANEVAIKVWTRPGDAILLDAECHILHHELGGPAVLSGVQAEPVPVHRGLMPREEVQRRLRPASGHTPGTTLLCLENTHNRCGGVVVPVEHIQALAALAHEHGAKVHLDGARLFNAAIAAGVPAARFAEPVDSVMFSLSKGLCCPVGSLLVGPQDFIAEARRVRKLFGGGMRQVGILAAAGLIALDTMIPRLEEDHRRARRLAEALAELPGLRVDLETVQTNLVYVETEREAPRLVEELAAEGVLALALDAHRLRLVTHHDVNDEGLEHAIRVFQRVSRRKRDR
jgi:threonine aldolase